MKKINKILATTAVAGVLSVVLGSQSVSAAFYTGDQLIRYQLEKLEKQKEENEALRRAQITNAGFKQVKIEDSQFGNVYNVTRESTPITGTLNLTRSSSYNSTIGRKYLQAPAKVIINMPNNSRQDLIQGTITLKPSNGGAEKSYDFMNYAKEKWQFDIYDIRNGNYTISLKAAVIGVSNKGTLTYTIE